MPKIKLSSKISLVILSTTISLVICEILLHMLWPIKVADFRGITVRDKEIGWRFIPNSQKVIHGILNDYSTTININSYGFRSPEYSLKPRPSTFRIALLGDSEVFGIGVSEKDMLNVKMEALLNQDIKITYEVLNFAMPGTGTIVQERIFERIALDWKPDVAIFFVTVSNDLSDNIHFTNRQNPANLPPKRSLTILGKLKKLQLYQLAKYKILPILPRFMAPRSDWFNNVPPFVAEWFMDKDLERSFALMTEALSRANELCHQNKIMMYLAVNPARSQFVPSIIRILRKTTKQDLLQLIESDWDRPQRMISSFASEKGIPHIQVLDRFKQLAIVEGVKLKYPNDGHLNSRGTFELAILLTDAIKDLQMTPARHSCKRLSEPPSHND